MRVVTGLLAVLALVLAGCGGPAGSDSRTLTIGAIPDQDPQQLQRRYGIVADYLSRELGVAVRYEPVTDYTAAVTAFRRGDLELVFFGGLTGVQARLQVPGARAIAQRGIDNDFRSVFIAGTDTGLEPIETVAGLAMLAGHSFTFGSRVSTSGRLMPQYFLSQAGVRLQDFAGKPGFSGSHDKTIALVEAGAYDVGVLNEAVWDERVAAGEVDLSKVREIFRTPTYHDYHWLIHPSVEEQFGAGFTARLTRVLLELDGETRTEQKILDLFSAEKFIPTDASNYRRIEQVARKIGLIE